MHTDPDAHKRMTQRHKEGFEKKKAAAQLEKGLLIVNTGTGKGKSTAAFGMGMRVLGHGWKLGVVQFIKGALDSAERRFLSAQAELRFPRRRRGVHLEYAGSGGRCAHSPKGLGGSRAHDRGSYVPHGDPG